MRNEGKESAEGLLHNKYNQAHAISSLCPLLYGLRSHGRDSTKDVSVLLNNRPKFHRHRKGYANIRYIRKDSLQVLLPCFCGTLSTTGTESRFAGIEHQLRLRFGGIDLRAESDGSAIDDFEEVFANTADQSRQTRAARVLQQRNHSYSKGLLC